MKKVILSLAVPFMLLSSCTEPKENLKENLKETWEYHVMYFKGESLYDSDTEDKQQQLINDYYPKAFFRAEMIDTLNALGEQGWELVSVVPITESAYPNLGNEKYNTGIRTNTRTGELKFFYKRRKLEELR